MYQRILLFNFRFYSVQQFVDFIIFYNLSPLRVPLNVRPKCDEACEIPQETLPTLSHVFNRTLPVWSVHKQKSLLSLWQGLAWIFHNKKTPQHWKHFTCLSIKQSLSVSSRWARYTCSRPGPSQTALRTFSKDINKETACCTCSELSSCGV